jgi:pimeloyl-ACP methyl ester carboxylesterase
METNNNGQMRALARHTGDAVVAVTDSVEGTSQAVRAKVRRGLGPLGGLPMDVVDAHNSGVYASVRAGARVASWLLEQGLPASSPAVVGDSGSAAYVAAAGAAFGDRLDPSLTTPMGLWRDGRPIAATDLPSSPALVVFVHGLGATELLWDPGYLEVCDHALVRYNTGRPIADNGHDLAALLDEVADRTGAQRLIIVGHSMGGLVARSAIAQAGDATWVRALTDLVTLGSPHSGAALERVAARALDWGGRFPSAAPTVRLGQYRSRGIKDLRFGAMSPGDWRDDVDTEFVDNTAVIELPRGVRHHAVVAQVADGLGDGIVGVSSASHTGAQIITLRGNHMSLLQEPRVTRLIEGLVAAESEDSTGS